MNIRSATLLVFGCLGAVAAFCGQIPTRTPPPPPQANETPRSEETFNPYRAEKNIEIGRYYLKKGNYDAAIERFEEATRYKPRFAIPQRLLGEAYEKKGDKTQAVQAYQKYLEILPHASDADKIQKHIARLKRELEQQNASRPAGRN
jgi:tetratricopeptide (TPR) repeat protein